MISFNLLDKDDLKVLFEGFNTDFLNIPLKRPSKTLVKFVPTGFRIGKLPRNRLIRMYCDAVYSKEPSLSEYVKNEISRNFNDRGINDYLNNVDVSNPLSVGLSISEIQSILFENGFTIPAYIVLLLEGVDCNDAMKEASKKLFLTHISIVEKASKKSEKRGKKVAEAASAAEIDAAERNNKRIQKHITELENQLTNQQKEAQRLQQKINEIEENLFRAHESEKNATEKNESFRKQITTLKNENQKLQNELDRKKVIIEENDLKLSELEKLHQTITDLRFELSQAKEEAYSDVVLKRLCSEIMDEIKASPLSDDEVLSLAKKRFKEADTIVDAWYQISNYSQEHMKQIIDNISNSTEAHSTLDVIEEIEDGILIKFAVLKAIKSILYNELEIAEAKRTISDKFISDKD